MTTIFRVRGWIVPHLALIEACAEGRAIFDQYCADFRTTGRLLAFVCLLNRELHEMEILLSGHAGWMLSRWSIGSDGLRARLVRRGSSRPRTPPCRMS